VALPTARAERVLEMAKSTLDRLHEIGCAETLDSPAYRVYVAISYVLYKHYTTLRPLEDIIEEYEEEAPEEEHITKLLKKPAHEIVEADLLRYLLTLEGRLISMCRREILELELKRLGARYRELGELPRRRRARERSSPEEEGTEEEEEY